MSTSSTPNRSRRPAGTPTGGQFAPEAHAEPEVTLNGGDRWHDDAIQFPRLIAEIAANVEGTPEEWDALCESMDLTPDELGELFDRANVAWERAKAAVAPENTPRTDENGHTFWRDANGQLHRTDGPAIEWNDGTREWFQHGQLHRTDGPAVEEPGGAQAWYTAGRLVERSLPMGPGQPDRLEWFPPDGSRPVIDIGTEGEWNWAGLAREIGPIEAQRLYLQTNGSLGRAMAVIVGPYEGAGD